MLKKVFCSSILFVSPILIGVSLPPFLTSCTIKKDTYLDIKKISRNYLKLLTPNQIASLHNSFKIFYFYKNGIKTYYDEAKFDGKNFVLTHKNKNAKYSPDFPYKKYWKQSLNQFNTYNINESNEKSNIKDFLNQYTFDEVDNANGFNDNWFLNLTNKTGKDYNRNGDPYFADLQTILFRLINDIYLDYSFMNSKRMINANGKSILKDNLFETQYIQSLSWLKDETQRKLFKAFLLLYLNKFNLGIKDIKINWIKEQINSFSGFTSYVKFKIESIIDFNNKELLPKDKKDIEYYLNGFRRYDTGQKFGVGKDGIKEKLPLFNEYIQNPLLEIDGKNYLNVVDNINEFIKGATDFEFWNSKGLMYLFKSFLYSKENNKNFFDFNIKVPEYKKHEDIRYQIIDFKYTSYLGTNQLFKAIVRVYKKNGTYQDYSWISSNFDDHGHRLKGQILNNKLDNLNSQDFYNYKEKLNKIRKGITLADFFNYDISAPNQDINKVYESNAFYKLLERIDAKMSEYKYWNNDIRQNYEADFLRDDTFQKKIFAAHLNNYLLSYALENKEGDIYSGIKRIDVTILKSKQIGRVYFRMDFVRYSDEDRENIKNNHEMEFKSKGEKIVQSVYAYWNGFKGFDNSITDKTFTIDKIEKGAE